MYTSSVRQAQTQALGCLSSAETTVLSLNVRDNRRVLDLLHVLFSIYLRLCILGDPGAISRVVGKKRRDESFRPGCLLPGFGRG